jgi:hypothetical protein
MNHFCVVLDCVPSSVFSGGGEQVDLARKLQEDPLYIIKKKEIESRSQILRNPVKLKQLQELVRMSLDVLPACMLCMPQCTVGGSLYTVSYTASCLYTVAHLSYIFSFR